MSPDRVEVARWCRLSPRGGPGGGGGVPADTTVELASVLRQAGVRQALRLIPQTGDGRWLRLRGAPLHHRGASRACSAVRAPREPAVAALHARLGARSHVGRRGSTFTIEFPVPVGKGARVTT